MRHFVIAVVLAIAACRHDKPHRENTASASAPPGPQRSDSLAPSAAVSPVDTGDFVVAGVAVGTDSTVVRAQIGRPDSSTRIAWFYPDFTLLFDRSSALGVITINGPRVATSRGLRVGDSQTRVRQLYGPPDYEGTVWQYYNSLLPGKVAIVRFTNGLVSQIQLGNIYDDKGE